MLHCVQEQEQQLHEKRVRQLLVNQGSSPLVDHSDIMRSSSSSLLSVYCERSLNDSISRRPDTAYEGRLGASALQASAAASAASSYADNNVGTCSCAPGRDGAQAKAGSNTQHALDMVKELNLQSCSTICESSQPKPPPPTKGSSRARPSPKSRQLSHNAWL